MNDLPDFVRWYDGRPTPHSLQEMKEQVEGGKLVVIANHPVTLEGHFEYPRSDDPPTHRFAHSDDDVGLHCLYHADDPPPLNGETYYYTDDLCDAMISAFNEYWARAAPSQPLFKLPSQHGYDSFINGWLFYWDEHGRESELFSDAESKLVDLHKNSGGFPVPWSKGMWAISNNVNMRHACIDHYAETSSLVRVISAGAWGGIADHLASK